MILVSGENLMETALELSVAAGVALSLYGAIQLATRGPLASAHLSPFWRSIYVIVVQGRVPPDLGGGISTFLSPDRKSKIGWRCLISGFLFQAMGSALSLVLKVAVFTFSGARR